MNLELIASTYVDTWNAAEASDRHALLEKYWDADARYVDPLMSGRGRDGIATMIAAARGQFPGHSFALDGKVDGHGDHLRFSWSLAPAGGAAIAGGTDFVRITQGGLIGEVVGFLDRAP